VVDNGPSGNYANSEAGTSNEVRDETIMNPFLMAQTNASTMAPPSINAGTQQYGTRTGTSSRTRAST
jgi:hypothetical protein